MPDANDPNEPTEHNEGACDPQMVHFLRQERGMRHVLRGRA